MGEIARLVIFPNQLVGTVVDIACGIRAVTDTQDIAVIVVGIAVGFGLSDPQGRCPPLGLKYLSVKMSEFPHFLRAVNKMSA